MESQISIFFIIFQILILSGGFFLGIRQIKLLSEQIVLMNKQIQEDTEWERRNATFNYINTYLTEFSSINQSLQKKIKLLQHDGKSAKIETLLNGLKSEKTRTELFHLVSYFENLAIGISCNYFDETIAKNFFYSVVISSLKTLMPYLMLRREETGLPVGSNFENLAKKWGNRKQ
ncbi:MAG: DUF4760 domain-containing protein [Alphaproteobacteria bacterium]|nr:MAG: DUF4760 domain-containing protein [Alphaproteobacteria bacterium]